MNEAVTIQASQKHQVLIEEGDMSSIAIRETIHSLSQGLATQFARDTKVKVNPNTNTSALSIKVFTRMNQPTLFCSKEEVHQQGLIDKVLKVLDAIGVTSQEKAELASY